MKPTEGAVARTTVVNSLALSAAQMSAFPAACEILHKALLHKALPRKRHGYGFRRRRRHGMRHPSDSRPASSRLRPIGAPPKRQHSR
jgi:hypothetical protein